MFSMYMIEVITVVTDSTWWACIFIYLTLSLKAIRERSHIRWLFTGRKTNWPFFVEKCNLFKLKSYRVLWKVPFVWEKGLLRKEKKQTFLCWKVPFWKLKRALFFPFCFKKNSFLRGGKVSFCLRKKSFYGSQKAFLRLKVPSKV